MVLVGSILTLVGIIRKSLLMIDYSKKQPEPSDQTG